MYLSTYAPLKLLRVWMKVQNIFENGYRRNAHLYFEINIEL